MTSVEWFHINHVASATRILICLVTLTFGLLTLKLVRAESCPWGGQPSYTNIDISVTFRSRFLDQHLSDTPSDIVTLTFDLGGHGACRLYGSSCFCLPNLKFVGHAVRKIWRIFGLSISRPGDLDLWPWNCCSLLPERWATFLPISVFLGLYALDLWANTCQTHHVTLRLGHLTLKVMALVVIRVFVLHLCTKCEVWTHAVLLYPNPSHNLDFWLFNPKTMSLLGSQRHSLYSLNTLGSFVFTCVSYAEARNRYRLDVRLSVCLSVTRWHCIKTAEYIVMLSSPRDSPFIVVFCVERSSRNSDGVTPCGAAKQRWGLKISQFSTNNLLYLRNGWR